MGKTSMDNRYYLSDLDLLQARAAICDATSRSYSATSRRFDYSLLLDWLISGHSLGQLASILHKPLMDSLLEWLDMTARTYEIAECWESLNLERFHPEDPHLDAKAFIFFKLRCEMALAAEGRHIGES